VTWEDACSPGQVTLTGAHHWPVLLILVQPKSGQSPGRDLDT